MNNVKNHFIFDVVMLIVAAVIGISYYTSGDGFEVLFVMVLTPIAFVFHFLVMLTIGLVKWNKEMLNYSFVGLSFSALALLIVYNFIKNTNMKIGG